MKAVQDVAAGDAGVVPRIEHEREELLVKLIRIQEDIDWLVYGAFGLLSHQFSTTPGDAVAKEGDRPFRTTDLHNNPPNPVWGTRASELHTSKELRLLEDPVYKRLWLGRRGVFGHGNKSFADDVAENAAQWIQEQVEEVLATEPQVRPLGLIARTIAANDSVRRVTAAILHDPSGPESVTRTMRDGDAVPFLAAYRHHESGMLKRAEWERVWDLQRAEDAGKNVGPIPVPPKYAQGDFRSSTYWRLRGKLDVPKERFISYPGCESDEDGEPVYGWAGWDHAQRAQALVALYQDRKTREGWGIRDRKTREGWGVQELTPMLAGVLELLPWLEQWHNEPSPEFDTTVFEAYDAFLDAELRDLDLTRDDLRAWRPPEKKKKKRRAKKKT
jgi:hypothetical protein